uniref:G-protein coupled receptors family 1 profile domain-containing protein n=2 Tax=Denticeps clupeoides TaxID=299321 RepID=A0AAY4EF49_9TELE
SNPSGRLGVFFCFFYSLVGWCSVLKSHRMNSARFSPNLTMNMAIMPRSGYSLFAAILGVFSVAGILLNALVIIVTLRHKQLRQPLNYALVNLAVADLGCAALGGVPTVVTTAMGYFSLGRIGCVLEAFAVAFFGIAALCSVAVIALDRYVVVCRPLGTVTFQTKHAMAGVAASWVWSFIWNTPPLFGWGGYELEGVQTSCGPDWYSRDLGTRSFIICYFLFCFAIPFSTIVVSYTSLLHKLRQVVKLQMAEGGTTAKAEVQVSRMVVVMVLAFLLTWLPYASFALSVVIIPDLYINPVIAAVPMYLTKCSTVFNPIIYIFMNRQFRDCTMPYLCCGRNPWASERESSEAEETAVTMVSKINKISPSKDAP